jgi:hypothetical protein
VEGPHFNETGFRTAGKLAWAHAASWEVRAGHRARHAWRPYDTFENVAGHALCGAHVLRELVAVTETGTDLDKAWAQQAIDALLALDEAAGAARAAGRTATGQFCAIRFYFATPPATASAHPTPSPASSRVGPGFPKPDNPARHHSAGRPEPESRPAYPDWVPPVLNGDASLALIR